MDVLHLRQQTCRAPPSSRSVLALRRNDSLGIHWFSTNMSKEGISSSSIGCASVILAVLTFFAVPAAINPELSPSDWTSGLIVASILGLCSLALAFAAFVQTPRAEDRSVPMLALGLIILAVVQAGFCVAVHRVRTADAGIRAMNNLKQLALACLDYEEAHGTFPPHAIYSRDGKPILSWRVMILPLIDEAELYHPFKLDEPWDSPHNAKLLDKMPKIYAAPSEAASNLTYYQAFYGPNTAFEGAHGTKVKDFTDGLAETILLIEAAEPVPWTKPQDLDYRRDLPVPRIGGLRSVGTIAAFANGRVVTIPTNISEQTLRALITRNAGDKPGKDWEPD
jgi:hypothetical protein